MPTPYSDIFDVVKGEFNYFITLDAKFCTMLPTVLLNGLIGRFETIAARNKGFDTGVDQAIKLDVIEVFKILDKSNTDFKRAYTDRCAEISHTRAIFRSTYMNVLGCEVIVGGETKYIIDSVPTFAGPRCFLSDGMIANPRQLEFVDEDGSLLSYQDYYDKYWKNQ